SPNVTPRISSWCRFEHFCHSDKGIYKTLRLDCKNSTVWTPVLLAVSAIPEFKKTTVVFGLFLR
uniref:Uncharacterized protein n=1 Tax=Aquila chrysaetos chrysaetos TaxID=223781 RepID=A0A663EPW5_AQUCH